MSGVASLTPRQRQVADLVATGLTNQEIATKLKISVHTVGRHCEKIFRKLNATTRSRVAFEMARAAGAWR